jgi:hypothetical protein
VQTAVCSQALMKRKDVLLMLDLSQVMAVKECVKQGRRGNDSRLVEGQIYNFWNGSNQYGRGRAVAEPNYQGH